MATEHLLHLAEAYATHRGLKLSTVATYAANAGVFFSNIQAGKSCTLRTYERVVGWFDTNWPADLEWPRHIPRPSRRKAVA